MAKSGQRYGGVLDLRGASPANRLSVLVVEDHPVHRRIEAMILEALGCYVTLASDGIEALEAIARAAFDVVIVDRHMPRCDGDSVAQTIRTTAGPSQRAIIACCSTDPPVGATQSLYDEVLAKPLASAAAAAVIQRAQHCVSLSHNEKNRQTGTTCGAPSEGSAERVNASCLP